MRHASFAVDRAAHDLWLRHARVTVEELGLSEEHGTTLWNVISLGLEGRVDAEGTTFSQLSGMTRSVPCARQVLWVEAATGGRSRCSRVRQLQLVPMPDRGALTVQRWCQTSV